MSRTWFMIALLEACGFVYYVWPSRDAYVVRLKQACVPDEGITFTMNYSGLGQVAFKVVPPDKPAAKAEKEKTKR